MSQIEFRLHKISDSSGPDLKTGLGQIRIHILN